MNTGLTGITLPDGVTGLGMHVFSGCRALTEITLPGDLLYIGKGAFHNCDGLRRVIFNGTALQWNRMRIEESDVLHNDALYQAAKDYRPEAYRAPVGGIIDSGFCGDRDGGRNLLWTLDDAGTLTIRGVGPMRSYDGGYEDRYSGWYYCAAPWGGDLGRSGRIRSVVIGDGVTSLGDFAFYGCQSLASATVPASVTRLGSILFGNCFPLTSINFGGTQAQWSALRAAAPNPDMDAARVRYQTQTAVPPLLTGDVDFDGICTASDARWTLRAAVGLERASDAQRALVDADRDGAITASDARLILRAAVGLEATRPWTSA